MASAYNAPRWNKSLAEPVNASSRRNSRRLKGGYHAFVSLLVLAFSSPLYVHGQGRSGAECRTVEHLGPSVRKRVAASRAARSNPSRIAGCSRCDVLRGCGLAEQGGILGRGIPGVPV